MAIGNVGDKTYETYFENGVLWHAWEIPVINERGEIARYVTRRSGYAPEPGDYRPRTEARQVAQEEYIARRGESLAAMIRRALVASPLLAMQRAMTDAIEDKHN